MSFAPPSGRAFLLDVPFQRRFDAQKAGARWDARLKAWVWRGAVLPAALRPFRPPVYSLERRRENALNGVRQGASQPRRNIVLRDHQAEATSAILRAERIGRAGFCLADDVGLGKTITAWKAILGMRRARTVLIVCPLAVVVAWRRTIEWMGDGGKDVVILNYDRLGQLFVVPPAPRAKRKKRTVRTLKGLARSGRAEAFDLVLWDESHRLKNPDSARSKFARKLNAKARFRLWLSATIGQNPLELSYLASLLAETTGAAAADLSDFEAWAASLDLGVTRGAYGKWLWSGDPEASAKVRRLLFEGAIPAGIRRRPEDVAGWPEINRIPFPIELEVEQRLLYEAAWDEFRRHLAALETAGLGLPAAAAAKARSKEAANGLVARLRLRQKGSLLRVAGTAEFALSLLENGHQVAISVAFLETLQALRRAFAAAGVSCAAITGAMSAEEKERERLSYQTGKSPLICFTVEEGISLHQGEHNDVPRAEIVHDLRWSAIQQAQIEGRSHRDGRFAPVYWAFAADTVEETVASVMLRRMADMKGLMGDDPEVLREIESALRAAALPEAA